MRDTIPPLPLRKSEEGLLPTSQCWKPVDGGVRFNWTPSRPHL